MPRSIVSRTATISLNNNSTALIKSLLNKSAIYDIYTEEEAIVACFLNLGIGPYKIVQGIILLVAGVMLAPIPCVVGVIFTDEAMHPLNPIAVSIIGMGLQSRSPNIPCRYTSRSFVFNNNELAEGFNNKGTIVCVDLGCASIPEIIDNRSNDEIFQRQTKQTVTGYILITAGLSRIIDGTWTTAIALPWGALRSVYYGGKKLFNSYASSRPDSVENPGDRVAYRL